MRRARLMCCTYLRDVVLVVTLIAARVVDRLDGDGDVGYRDDDGGGGGEQQEKRRRPRLHFRGRKTVCRKSTRTTHKHAGTRQKNRIVAAVSVNY